MTKISSYHMFLHTYSSHVRSNKNVAFITLGKRSQNKIKMHTVRFLL